MRTVLPAALAATLLLVAAPAQARELTVRDAGHDMWTFTAVTDPRPAPAAGCAGVRHRIDYRHDRVRLVVPRGCLHRPHRVRANLNVYRAGRGGRFWSDSAQTRRAHSDAWTRWLPR